MISNTAQVNTFTGGLNMDQDVNLIPDTQYRYAEDVRVITNDGGTTGVLQSILEDTILLYLKMRQ